MDILDEIRKELRIFIREMGLLNRNCLNSGMTLMQAHILSYINKNGTSGFFEVSSQLGIDKASLSRSLGSLSGKKYLKTRVHNADKRVKLIEILPRGRAAIKEADNSARKTLEDILNINDECSLGKIHEALKTLHFSSLNNNLRKNKDRIILESLRKNHFDSAMKMVEEIFSGEQNIPLELIPIDQKLEPEWWCARIGEDIAGTAAVWKEGGECHWGRFAVDSKLRGLGIGKKIAEFSIKEAFLLGNKRIIVEARDKTMEILKKIGGEKTGESFDFFGDNVTPMVIDKNKFLVKP